MSEALSVFIEACDSLTPLGDAATTATALSAGVRGLTMQPVLGEDGGDLVPLCTFEGMSSACPPRWLPHLDTLIKGIPDKPWGYQGYPVIVTSSNFGIGQLYAYSRDRDSHRKRFCLSHDCVDFLAERFKWGADIQVITNACVSAQLGIIEAQKRLRMPQTKAVLIVSYDFLSSFVTGGFHSLKILNGDYPRPYAFQESGSIGLGDGAAFAVLSHERSVFELRAHSVHFESWHMTGNEPSGGGFQRVAQPIVKASEGLKYWLKGHGTGTLEAGRLEAQQSALSFKNAPLVAWKGSIGHTLGSCGLVELGIAMAAVRQGVIPGTVGSAAPFFADNVQEASLQADAYNAFVLFSNAFAGAHTAHLIVHE